MKKLFVLTCLISMVIVCAHAQDKVILKTGDTLNVVVTKNAESFIEYTYPNETVVNEKSKKDISCIIYSSGRREEFKQESIIIPQIEGEDDSYTEKQLSEILPGRYVCSMNFFRKDHVNYRLESDGILVEDRTNILFETFQYDEKESRFFALNMLDDKESSLEEYEDYLRKACFVDEYLTLL